MNRIAIPITAAMLLIAGIVRGAAPEPVVTEALLNAPVDAVWKAMTTNAALEAWLVGRSEMDLRVGGAWRTNYSKDSNLKDDSTIQHMILAFDPGRMLSFRTVKAPANFPYPEITQTWNVWYFEPAGAGKTRVIARMLGFGEGEQFLKMRAFFERGNRSEMDKLVKFFENGIPASLR